MIDPKPLTQHSLLAMLQAALPDFTVRGAFSYEEVPQQYENLVKGPQLVVINATSSRSEGSWVQECLQHLKAQLPDAALILISERDASADIAAALACGVRGYIPTATKPEVAFAALRLVAAGGTFVPAHTVRVATAWPDEGTTAIGAGGGQHAGVGGLTTRELAVVHLLCEGKSNKAIALELNMQESTVKVHVRNIMQKLKVSNRTQAVSLLHRVLPQKPHEASVKLSTQNQDDASRASGYQNGSGTIAARCTSEHPASALCQPGNPPERRGQGSTTRQRKARFAPNWSPGS
ncbi:MAG: response regulator transcription factor, partial [Acetobacteraceae bacterium]|nr:response regulator transcription factor [Acetobacteraceae bacterium]